MGVPFASGKHSISECDRCGFRYKLTQLKTLVIKTKNVSIKVCPECWEPDQPQLQLGMWANQVVDPQAVREPRPDVSYTVSGMSGLQIQPSGTGPLASGYPEGGSRIIQWGFAPVGGAAANDAGLTPNNLAMGISIGTVTIAVT
jgi:hypothetical protein